MNLAILKAILVLALHGECLDASAYPEPRPGLDYVSLERCAIPATPVVPAAASRALFHWVRPWRVLARPGVA